MQVSFLSDSAAQSELLRLISACEQAQWAVAWATPNDLVDAAIAHKEKFKHLVVGTHLYQTNPEVLKRLSSVSTATAMSPSGTKLFHPKVYLFSQGGQVRAVVGSHNLTYGAMSRNIEASVLVEGTAKDPVIADLIRFVHRSWLDALPITEDFLYQYRHQWQAKRAARESLEKFVPLRRPRTKGTGRAPQEMTWAQYVVEVRKPSHHSLEERLRVLGEARRLFTEHSMFSAMGEDERKLVAGTLGRQKSKRDGTDYALFGSMGGSGAFAKLVGDNSTGLSRALDSIPITGIVTAEQYERYAEQFTAAFKGSSRIGSVPTASRLLAMKRPDVFVCLDAANRVDLCNHFGVASTTIDLDNYWERIVEQMMQTAWWQSTMPDDSTEQEIWRGRAALLDAIYYSPKK